MLRKVSAGLWVPSTGADEVRVSTDLLLPTSAAIQHMVEGTESSRTTNMDVSAKKVGYFSGWQGLSGAKWGWGLRSE